MNSKLYKQLFNKLDSLWAIRKDLTFGCEVILISTWWTNRRAIILEINKHYSKYLSKSWILSNNNANRRFKQSWEIKEIIWQPPVLSDCIKAIKKSSKHIVEKINWIYDLVKKWDNNKPLLSDQSDELGKYLLTLLN